MLRKMYFIFSPSTLSTRHCAHKICEAVAKQNSLRPIRGLLEATNAQENDDSQWFHLVKIAKL